MKITSFLLFFLLFFYQTLWAANITYPESTFQDGRARHYQYKTADGITVRYFIIKSSDGVIRAAFDACDICWPANKGYTQKSDFMVCNNCGKKFLSTKVNEVSGGCNPAPLKRAVENSTVILKTEDLEEGKKYFTFQGGKR